jgi:ketosteroid isomerase-like protein
MKIGATSLILAAGLLVLAGSLSSRITISAHKNTAADSFEDQIVAAERAGLDALKAGDVGKFGDFTADEAVFVDAHGPATKAQVLQNVVGFKLTDYTMDNIQVKRISPNTGLLVYKITETGVSHGKEFTAQVYISSIWTERDKKWLCLFSQETGARPAQ